MKRLCCLGLLGWLLMGSLSFSYAADVSSKPADYRETPNPLRLFVDQWTPYPPPPGKYTLEFLRTADEETSSPALREAVLVGLDNNPGIVVDGLRTFESVYETISEKLMFDLPLNLEFNKDY